MMMIIIILPWVEAREDFLRMTGASPQMTRHLLPPPIDR